MPEIIATHSWNGTIESREVGPRAATINEMQGHSSTAEPTPRVTFSLGTVFFVFAVLCVLLAEYQAMGVEAISAWWFTLLLVAAFVMQRQRLWAARNLAIGTFLVTGFFATLPQMCGPRWGWGSLECVNRIKTLGMAAHDYELRHKSLPPQKHANDAESPGLSWRVMLLPFLGHDPLYKQFDLQRSWQSPGNRPLANIAIPEFRCPAESNTRANEASYVAITGDDTCWPASGPISLAGVKDGISNTILFTETHDSGILWPEPRDLEYDNMEWRIHGSPGNSISSSHGPVIRYFDGSAKVTRRTRVHVIMADGSSRSFTNDVDPDVLKQMANRRDGLPRELP